MKQSHVIILSVGGIAAIAVGAWLLFAPRAELISFQGNVFQQDNPVIVAQGGVVYAENCAACHGVNLEGEENWRSPGPDGLLPAPPHDETGHTWHHTEDLLFGITKYGLGEVAGLKNYESNMPIYKDVLSDEEILAVLSYIKSTWPADIQTRHTGMSDQERKANNGSAG